MGEVRDLGAVLLCCANDGLFSGKSGSGWENQWVQFDFLSLKRVARVFLDAPPSSRAPTRLRLDHSLNGINFVEGTEKDLPFDKIIRLTKPIITRFLRIFVVEVNDVTENINAVSMFR